VNKWINNKKKLINNKAKQKLIFKNVKKKIKTNEKKIYI